MDNYQEWDDLPIILVNTSVVINYITEFFHDTQHATNAIHSHVFVTVNDTNIHKSGTNARLIHK